MNLGRKLALAALTGALALSGCSGSSNGTPNASSDLSAKQVDAMMQYASFAAFWDGSVFTNKNTNQAVTGVDITISVPPFDCAIAKPAAGTPSGSQAAWVFGQYTYFAPQGPVVSTLAAQWPKGLTSCDERKDGVLMGPSLAPTKDLSGGFFFASKLNDPTVVALDVKSVYAQIPQDKVTDYGRKVYAKYLEAYPAAGTVADSKDTVGIIAGWLAGARGNKDVPIKGSTVGPTDIVGGTAGTASLGKGYTASWNSTSMCVQVNIGDEQWYANDAVISDSMNNGGVVVPLNGVCPAK